TLFKPFICVGLDPVKGLTGRQAQLFIGDMAIIAAPQNNRNHLPDDRAVQRLRQLKGQRKFPLRPRGARPEQPDDAQKPPYHGSPSSGGVRPSDRRRRCSSARRRRRNSPGSSARAASQASSATRPPSSKGRSRRRTPSTPAPPWVL